MEKVYIGGKNVKVNKKENLIFPGKSIISKFRLSKSLKYLILKLMRKCQNGILMEMSYNYKSGSILLLNNEDLCIIRKYQYIFRNLIFTHFGRSMKTSKTHDERIAKMTFSSVYPHYLEKVKKKGRTKVELHQVIEWLTNYDEKKLQELIKEKVTFEKFFQNASINPNANLIIGVICGYRVEEIENELTQQVRYLDKLVDELAKGRKMEKILRTNK